MAGGRPTSYTKDTVKKAREYIASCVDIKNGGKLEVHLPTTEGLALYLDVSRKTLYNWAEEHDEFLHILERCNQTQANRVINNAMGGLYNPLIAKLLLGKHGYKDQMGISGEEEGEGIKLHVDITDRIKRIYRPGSDKSTSK